MKASPWFAIVVMVSMLLLPSLARAQDATPASGAIQRETLVEMTISPDLMPDPPVSVRIDRHTVAPGVVAEFDKYDEGIRGRSMYVESGVLIVEPVVSSLVWRADSPIGAVPEVAQPGDMVQLATGDSMYLPAIPKDSFPTNGLIRITNPGNEPAVQIGVHLHEGGGGFSEPAGYSYSSGAEYYGPSGLERIKAGDTLFRFARITAQPGTVLPYSDEAVVTFYQIDSGELTSTTADATTEQRWTAGPQAWFVTHNAQSTQELRVSGDIPAQIIELTVIPSTSAKNGATASDTTSTTGAAIASPVKTTGMRSSQDPINRHLGAASRRPDGSVEARTIWQDVESRPDAVAPGLTTIVATVSIDDTDDHGTTSPTYELTTDDGIILDSSNSTESIVRMTIDSDPVWTDVETGST